MQFSYLTEQDIKTFEDKYPGAAHYILNQCLYRERIALKTELVALTKRNSADEAGRTRWVTQRVAELDDFRHLEDKSIIKEQ
jgi:hypothetical protein